MTKIMTLSESHCIEIKITFLFNNASDWEIMQASYTLGKGIATRPRLDESDPSSRKALAVR